MIQLWRERFVEVEIDGIGTIVPPRRRGLR
jgi:hypothetical protein